MAVFTPIFISQELENTTKLLLQEWFPTFIVETCDQHNIDPADIKIPEARNYSSRSKYDDTLPGEAFPRVVVISPGIMGAPKMDGGRQYRAIWRLGIGVATVATSEETAKLHGDIYAAAAREIMIKYGGGALNGNIVWLDEQYADLPGSDTIQQARAVALWFSVDINNVASKRGGPTIPDAAPYTPHIAQTVSVQLAKEQ